MNMYFYDLEKFNYFYSFPSLQKNKWFHLKYNLKHAKILSGEIEASSMAQPSS